MRVKEHQSNSSLGLVKLSRPKSLGEAVLNSLARFVEESAIKSGDRLPSERRLCDALQVGRSTVREALKRWETLGIIERRHGSGIYLCKAVGANLVHVPLILERPSKIRGLLQLLQVRRGLEGEAAAACAQFATADDIANIMQALEHMEKRHAAGDSSEADWQLHRTIYAATGNALFLQLIQSIHDLFHQLWKNPLRLPRFAEASYPFHRTMCEAIARRDGKKARAEAWKLVDSVVDDIKKAFPDEA